MAKKILFFNFDGTDNEPADAVQDKNYKGDIEDDSISNVLKFHLLLGGKLIEKTGRTELENGSLTFYYHGIGTYGNFFQRKYNAGLALESKDVAKILRDAKEDFSKEYNDTFDYVVVTGFSRGAALARRFASLINDSVKGQVIIEGVFDTVASIGLPNLSKKDRPTSDVVFENGCSLPSNVKKALHLVSLDDKRKAFQPTLMNKADHIEEIWFPGAHSDVGGGYNFDGLSDNSLRYFLDWFEEQPDLEIAFKSPKSLDYDGIFGGHKKLKIGPDDVQIDPNPFGVNHQQDRTPLISKITLTDRVCCVIKNDKIATDEEPVLHWSIAERISGDRNYRPRSLHNTKHYIQYQDRSISGTTFSGYSEHKLKIRSNVRPATPDGIESRVYAHLKYNHTGIFLIEGHKYRIEVVDVDKQHWRDGGIKHLDGNGWDRGDVRLGAKEIAIAAMEPFRRVTKDGAKWFTLCGCICDDDKNAFVIGNQLENFTATRSGELCAFANDLDGYYGNNSGFLKIKVTDIS